MPAETATNPAEAAEMPAEAAEVAGRPNYNLVVRQADTPVTLEKIGEIVSFVTKEH
jgi:hypothetical protein